VSQWFSFSRCSILFSLNCIYSCTSGLVFHLNKGGYTWYLFLWNEVLRNSWKNANFLVDMSSNLVLTIVRESEMVGILCTYFMGKKVENCTSFIAATTHTNSFCAISPMQMSVFKEAEGIFLSTQGRGQCRL
jgi:hypothetical protein